MIKKIDELINELKKENSGQQIKNALHHLEYAKMFLIERHAVNRRKELDFNNS